jgi:hypothetical protein
VALHHLCVIAHVLLLATADLEIFRSTWSLSLHLDPLLLRILCHLVLLVARAVEAA